LILILLLLVAAQGALVACSNGKGDAPEPDVNMTGTGQPGTVTPVSDLPQLAAAPSPTTSMAADDLPESSQTPQPPTATATWPAVGAQVPCGILLPILADDPQPVARKFDDLAAELSLPEAARPAYERILAAPETVGLAAFQVGQESEGVYLNADVPMPLASVVKIITLIAYANAAAAGELDPAEWVTLDEIGQTYLPRSDLGAHNRALQELGERQLIAFDPPATPLEEVPWMMIRHSSNAAADYLHLRLGQRVIEQTVIDLGLESHTAPCPWIGQFLAIANRQTSGSNRQAVQSYLDNPEHYGYEAMRLAESYANDEAYRASESEPGWRASFDTQLLFADNLNAQANARDYAGLMSRIVQNQLSNGYTNIVVRRALEWPMAFLVNQELFTTIGLKDGSLPGVLTTAYYAQRIEDGATIVVVLFYRQLPRQTYQQWRRDLPNDEFARWLLSDPEAIQQLRAALQQAG
jgi:D-alanyl-D-alanine carboxypeptidase